MRKSLSSLTNEIMIIINESKKDDKVDADGDGIPDAKQISGRELMKRKVKLVLTKMDPEKVNTAIASIYKGVLNICIILAGFIIRYFLKLSDSNTIYSLLNYALVWMSVLAVLTIQFARTIALALTIAEFSKSFMDRFILPILKKATPDEYQVCCCCIQSLYLL